jgi:fatty-acyl-CoA synthase
MSADIAQGPDQAPTATVAAALRTHAANRGDRDFLRFEDTHWTYAEAFREACRYANLFLLLRQDERPFHVGVLMDNVPPFLFAELGCALAGAALVGLNPTRSGAALARDIEYADCQMVIVEPRYAGQLQEALALIPNPAIQVFVDSPREDVRPPGWMSLENELAAVPDDDPEVPVQPSDLLLIIFTSGTTKAPKGVLNSNQRIMLVGLAGAMMMSNFQPDDVVYSAMPLYHANAQALAVAAALAVGGCIALARRFSKSNFLSDVRRYGATLFNYVGNPLAYIMDTPEKTDDADNPLRLAFGNEAPRQFIESFGKRFGCRVVDGYGASEVGVGFTHTPDDPPRSLGRADTVRIINENGEECARATFDDSGRLTNAAEAVGEIVNTGGALLFEGYYKDEASTRQRTRNGRFYTGDLGYMDAEGFVYFAGRDAEWVRVGGENFLVRPIEEIISRHPDVMLVSVYGVPDPEAGDQLMAAIELRTGTSIDPVAFSQFLDQQPDLPPRWRPTFLRVAKDLKTTASNKVLKRVLQREKFLVDQITDPVYWRQRGAREFRLFTSEDLGALRERFQRAGYADRLEN